MEIANVVLGVLVLALGGWVFVLVRSGSEARAAANAAQREQDRLADENAHLMGDLEEARRELELARAQAEASSQRVTELSVEQAKLVERLDAGAKLIEEFKANREQLVQQFEALGSRTLKSNQEALGKFITERLKDADSLSQAELDKRKQ
ncbi:MAG TPA: hypothetical protein DF699_13685, partial [Phycisphaerales bacterium]|nr:hypothetical protein [Phycisphaerales bacterium]